MSEIRVNERKVSWGFVHDRSDRQDQTLNPLSVLKEVSGGGISCGLRAASFPVMVCPNLVIPPCFLLRVCLSPGPQCPP